MTLPVRPPLRPADDPMLDMMTSMEAYRSVRENIADMNVANAAYDRATADADMADAMDMFDTASNALLGLMIMLEARGVLADIEDLLNATYGRV